MRKEVKMLIYLALWMLLPTLVFFGVLMTPVDRRIHAPVGHFYIVSIVALLALLLSMSVGIIAIKLRNVKIVFMALAFVSMSAFFVMHGLSTPGFLHSQPAVVGDTAQMSIILAVIWLWLSSMSSDSLIIRGLTKYDRLLVPVWLVILAILCYCVWSFPEIIQMLQLKSGLSKVLLTFFIVAVMGWTMVQYFKTYINSKFPLQLAIVFSSGWLIVAQIVLVLGEAWMISWWIYHFLLLGSVIAMVAGLIRQYSNRGVLAGSWQMLFRSNPHNLITAYMTNSVRKLVIATEERDAYTAGHNYRVAMYALLLAQEMGLSDEEQKAIVQGGIVHDVGKLRIPDVILNKPGRLTDDERAVIETHPVSGYDLCKRLGFMSEELGIIRWHHEKWDGTGYPDRIAGDRIPLLARVTAVADVYDALTSTRAYRKAMTHEEAMEIIVKDSETHFDPQCVEAWVKLAEEKRHLIKYTSLNAGQLVFE